MPLIQYNKLAYTLKLLCWCLNEFTWKLLSKTYLDVKWKWPFCNGGQEDSIQKNRFIFRWHSFWIHYILEKKNVLIGSYQNYSIHSFTLFGFICGILHQRHHNYPYKYFQYPFYCKLFGENVAYSIHSRKYQLKRSIRNCMIVTISYWQNYSIIFVLEKYLLFFFSR